MDNSKIIITSACRTAVGSLGKSLKNIKADELCSAVISSAITNSKINPDDLDEVIMGQVLTGGSGQNPARQAAMKSGIPVICSNLKIFKEIADDSVLYFEKQNENDLCSKMNDLIENKNLYNKLILSGLERSGMFNRFNFIKNFEKLI